MQLRHAAFLIASFVPAAIGQNRLPGAPPPTPNDTLISPEVAADHAVTFRIYAPKAEKVYLASEFKGGNHVELTKADNGVWSVTTAAIDPGTYRYTYNVDGVRTLDPKNPDVSESVGNDSSYVVVPGAAFMDASNDVPHGAVAEIYYKSTALGRMRRMHVYTPPGYELGGREKYPVFYLLHGAGDNDDCWTSVGRANFILDNLIASKKAKPMIIVMPAGHTSAGRFTPGSGDEFLNDFTEDVMPYVNSHYRVLTDRKDTALAGLSMGGAQTLNLMARMPEKFAYIGVFSSGIIALKQGGGGFNPNGIESWAAEHASALDSPGSKKGLKLVWFSTGADDFLLQVTKSTVEMLSKHDFHPEFHESTGGHTWINWRDYLNEFAPMLFQ
ncbi:MAG TPA: alpha/beta hydrolase-fold protein [Bryobacteraceae bacterium]|jgi:enterochelin esterase family protein